jgi:serine/threonine protein kinase
VSQSAAGRVCPQCQTEYPPGVLRCPKDNQATSEAATASGTHPLAGTFIGSYRVKKLIGAGGMGEVLLGEHPTLGVTVAIKILRDEVSRDAEQVARFFAEAKTIASLQHPNIVEVLDLSVLPDGRAYYIMEHLRGHSLARVLSRAKMLPPNEALPLFRELLSALSVAHKRGVVHRDIKPANIFLLSELQNGVRVKLLDFGIAKLLGPTQGRALSLPGVVLGTPAYMSPEQAMGKPVTASSDLYSVGVMLFEALTGELPFGDIDDVAQMGARVRQAPPKPSSRRPELAPYDRLLALFLEKEPARRIESADAAIAAIRAVEQGNPIEEPEEAMTVRRAPIAEDTSEEETLDPNSNDEPSDVATHIAVRIPGKPKEILKQDNIAVSADLLLSQKNAPVKTAPAEVDATVRLRASRPKEKPNEAAIAPVPKAPFVLLGVVGVVLLLIIFWFLS